ncbi:chromosomal replication initiator protein [Metamycoplasma subdolum]|uniref:Chromosomal replication initiator protein DnaA n=1 Tax=Metamycoplasma subdolum TaxID=92407 RepID=A0A3M0AIT1_9BACT|nr:chromosomal replication initiator protein DnaA [Metamycoplasma subdolum]RMA79012.1 chromosomal replication initiator protein [Metamycoplasma subdolum]WPB50535.1 chromosomal replication initiator protein DnaA [Metamycoplasma subdolum]
MEEELKNLLAAENITFTQEIKNTLSDDFSYEHFFRPIRLVHIENNTIYVFVPAPVLDYIKNKYFNLIENAALVSLQREKGNVVFIANINEIKSLKAENEEKDEVKKPLPSNINPTLTFENYAVGKFNSLVVKSARNVCEKDEVQFSPLFIHSPSGLGKTHLLHAIGNELIKKSKSCYYINPYTLTSKIVEQLRNKNQEELNKIIEEILSYDCVMLDDVQQYANKESTLNVLFNIFSTLINDKKKQLIITADKKPSDLGGFEERFITRFDGGLTVEITNPEIDDVISILKLKLKQHNIDVNLWEDEALRFVARNFSSSVRSLENAINRIKLISEGDDYFTYDLYTMQTIFKNVSLVKDNITPEKIIDQVAKYYNLDKRKLTAKTRKEEVVIARRISIWLIKNNFNYSLQKIGKMFGDMSHSNVIVSIQWIDANIKSNSTVKVAIQRIKENLNKYL